MTDLLDLIGDNPNALEIARQQPPFWEYKLSAALLRQHLKGPARKWRDLREGLYTQRLTNLRGIDVLPWFNTKIAEASRFIEPLVELYTVRLPKSWGEPGQAGDIEEIAHVCTLIGSAAAELVRWEEDVAFTKVPKDFEGLRNGLAGAAGHQIDELVKVPDVLEYGVDQAVEESAGDEPTVIQHTIMISLPEGWTENLQRQFGILNQRLEAGQISFD